MPKRHWLMKSEPDVFSFDDLKASPRRTTEWEGVRSYQARNFMREMKKGDEVLFYHSNAKPPAVVGIATIVRTAYPDPEQFDPKSHYHDPKSDRAAPRWDRVDIEYLRPLPRPVSLDEIRKTRGLENMVLVKRGRLSVQPVTPAEWQIILRLARNRDRSTT